MEGCDLLIEIAQGASWSINNFIIKTYFNTFLLY